MNRNESVALPAEDFRERWLEPGAVVPVGVPTTGALLREVQRLRKCLSEAHTALGSLQELLAKQIAVRVPRGAQTDGALACAACGWINDAHGDSCPVDRGLKIIEAALHQNSSLPFQEKP